jgi:predicted DNA binding protein
MFHIVPIRILEASGLKPKILEIGKFKPKGEVLTEKQERVLWLALKMGFFDFPRKITMLELSSRLGVGLSTLSEIARRGIRRLLEYHFEA